MTGSRTLHDIQKGKKGLWRFRMLKDSAEVYFHFMQGLIKLDL